MSRAIHEYLGILLCSVFTQTNTVQTVPYRISVDGIVLQSPDRFESGGDFRNPLRPQYIFINTTYRNGFPMQETTACLAF